MPLFSDDETESGSNFSVSLEARLPKRVLDSHRIHIDRLNARTQGLSRCIRPGQQAVCDRDKHQMLSRECNTSCGGAVMEMPIHREGCFLPIS